MIHRNISLRVASSIWYLGPIIACSMRLFVTRFHYILFAKPEKNLSVLNIMSPFCRPSWRFLQNNIHLSLQTLDSNGFFFQLSAKQAIPSNTFNVLGVICFIYIIIFPPTSSNVYLKRSWKIQKFTMQYNSEWCIFPETLTYYIRTYSNCLSAYFPYKMNVLMYSGQVWQLSCNYNQFINSIERNHSTSIILPAFCSLKFMSKFDVTRNHK